MSIPKSADPSPTHAYEPTMWCGPCERWMTLTWLTGTPAWRFECPGCHASGTVWP
jgi:hypothetical protein